MSSIPDAEKFLIVGAGAAGLTTAKNLRDHGIPVDVVEANSKIGGHWSFGQPGSAVYKSLHMISSKRFSEFNDFPMPADYPTYISHRQAYEYFDAYAKEFDIYSVIRFGQRIEQVRRLPDGLWAVTIEGELPRTYRGVILANGHLRKPSMPTFDGEFDGDIIHSKDYRDAEVLRGKRVLVLGGGNSGCDIAVEASQNGERAFHSLRRGYYFWPKFIFGLPADLTLEVALKMRIPLSMRRAFGHVLLRLNSPGGPGAFGLQRPTHRLYGDHFTMNSTLMYALAHGDITPKPDVSRLMGHEVEFSDGSRESVDLIVCATGYELGSIPFMNVDDLQLSDGTPRFLHRIFHPEYDNLAMIGFFQTNTGNWPMMEWQARLLAKYLCARRSRSSKADKLMRYLRRKSDQSLDGGLGFYGSSRHSIQIEHFSYRNEVRKMIRMLGSVRPYHNEQGSRSVEHHPSQDLVQV